MLFLTIENKSLTAVSNPPENSFNISLLRRYSTINVVATIPKLLNNRLVISYSVTKNKLIKAAWPHLLNILARLERYERYETAPPPLLNYPIMANVNPYPNRNPAPDRLRENASALLIIKHKVIWPFKPYSAP